MEGIGVLLYFLKISKNNVQKRNRQSHDYSWASESVPVATLPYNPLTIHMAISACPTDM